MKQDEETQTAFAIRAIKEEERERCAKIAERVGGELREQAIGGAIAKAIRAGARP